MTMPYRRTVLVPDRVAVRHHARQAARDRAHGTFVATPAHLVQRLAGPALRQVTLDEFASVLEDVPPEILGDLSPLGDLPGLAAALARSLHAADAFDLDLAAAPASTDGDLVGTGDRARGTRVASRRFEDLARIRAWATARLPVGTAPASAVIASALQRVHLAPALLGPVEVHGIVDLPPSLRRVVEEVARHVPVRWTAPAHPHAWVPTLDGVSVSHRPNQRPRVHLESHADPVHEVRAALRWVRATLARGVSPGEVAVVALDPAPYDAVWTVHAREADLPVHATDGVARVHEPAGRLAAAWCEARQLGPTRSRLTALLRIARVVEPDGPLSRVDVAWDDVLDQAETFHHAAAWRCLPRRVDPTVWQEVVRLVDDLTAPDDDPDGEAHASGRWLEPNGKTLAIVEQAGSRAVGGDLLGRLERLRIDDGQDPVTSVLWTRPEVIVATPRAHVRVLGVATGMWPRANEEDPLLPSHVLGDRSIALAPRGRQDRWMFEALQASTPGTVVVTYPRRSSDGKERSPSPLTSPWRDAAVDVPSHAATPTPFSESDRRASRPNERAKTPHVRAAMATWNAWHEPEATPHDGLVRPDHPATARALSRPMSPSRAAPFLHDAFGFALSNLHGVTEPDVRPDRVTMDPRAFGTFVHAVLERMSLHEDAATATTTRSWERAARAVDEAVDAEARAWLEAHPPLPTVVWEATLADARRLAVAAWMHASQQTLHAPGARRHAEVRFGMPDPRFDVDVPWPPEAAVPVPGSRLTVRGVIDRVDLSADGRTAWVTDYKTGASKSASELARGREVQRALYALVVRHHLTGDDGPPTVHASLVYPRDGVERVLEDVDGEIARTVAALSAAEERARSGSLLPGRDALFDRFREHALALPADVKAYAARKGTALRAQWSIVERMWADDADDVKDAGGDAEVAEEPA